MKKGMELSMNFIVVFIISIVILFFGIKFVYDIMNQGGIINEVLTAQVNNELENLASQGKRISIAFNSGTISPGEHQIFGLGILNMDATHKYFAIGFKPGPAYDNDNNLIEPNPLQLPPDKKMTIELDELEKVAILVKVPRGTKPGNYIVNVYVCNSDSTNGEYDGVCGEGSDENFYDKENPVRKIYVEVP